MFTHQRLMRRLLPLLLAALVAGGVLTACNGKKQQPTSQPTASTIANSCASAGTKHLTKARIVADLGISVGAFHRYVYKPIKNKTYTGAGKFTKVKILAKGAIAVLAIKHFMGNAIDNARADATLCKYVPTMDQVQAKLAALASKFKHGSTSGIDDVNSSFSSLDTQAGITPNDNAALPTG